MEKLKKFLSKLFCEHQYDIWGWGYTNDEKEAIFVWYKCKKCNKMKKEEFTNQFIIETFLRIHEEKHIF